MSQLSSPSAATRPRRSRAALKLTAWLAGLAVVVSAFAWFEFVNATHAHGLTDGRVVVATDTAVGRGVWHWVHGDGTVGEALTEASRVVPGDRVGYVVGGELTDTVLVLPATAGNETQGQRINTADGSSYDFAAANPGVPLVFDRSRVWMLATGAAVALALGAVASGAVAATRRSDARADR